MKRHLTFVFSSEVIQDFNKCLKDRISDSDEAQLGSISSNNFNSSPADLLEELLVLAVDGEIRAGHILQEEVLLLTLRLVETRIGLIAEPTRALRSACRIVAECFMHETFIALWQSVYT